MIARTNCIVRLFGLALTALVSTPGSAAGQGSASQPAAAQGDALRLYGQAMRHFENGAYEQAIPLYEQALARSRHPNNLYYLGECHRRLGDLRRSHEHYARYAATLPLEKRSAFDEKLARLRGGRPSPLKVSSVEPGVEVLIDGALVGRTIARGTGAAMLETTVAAGEHAVVLRRAGLPEVRQQLTAEFGEPLAVAVSFPAPRPAPPQRSLLVVEAAGFRPQQTQVELAAGERKVMRLRLDPLRPAPATARAGWPRKLVLWTTIASGVLAASSLASGIAFNAGYNAEPPGSSRLDAYKAASVSSYIVAGALALFAGAGLVGHLTYGRSEAPEPCAGPALQAISAQPAARAAPMPP